MEEIIKLVAKGEGVRVETIKSNGAVSPKDFWYDQSEDEYASVVKGSAILEYESGKKTSIGTGEVIFIPAHTKHRVAYTDADCEWICIFLKKI